MSAETVSANAAGGVAVVKTEGVFERFIDKLLPFLKKAESVADAARPVLALTPIGPEYNLVLTGIETATAADLQLQAAGGAALTGAQKMAIALSVATPQVTSILATKGITTPAVVTAAIQQFAQNVFNLQTGPAAAVAAAK